MDRFEEIHEAQVSLIASLKAANTEKGELLDLLFEVLAAQDQLIKQLYELTKERAG